MEEEDAKRRLEEEEEENKRAKQRIWQDIVKAGGGPILFNATMLGADGGGDILALSKTHVVVSGTTRIAMRVPLDVTFNY